MGRLGINDLGSYSGIFRGGGVENNKAILDTLLTEKGVGAWEITRKILSNKPGKKPDYEDVMAKYPSIFRRIKKLTQTGHIKRAGKVKSEKGLIIDTYQLSLSGSLAALLLALDEKQLKEYLTMTTSVNPISQIATYLMEDNEDWWPFVRKMVKDNFVHLIHSGVINIDVIKYNTMLNVFGAFREQLCDFNEAPQGLTDIEAREEVSRAHNASSRVS